jgi:tRNA pseudouridine55 synthase
MVDGLLIIDKPAGLTSHDVVAAARRALGERRIGHTGTLDPIATGVLPLACGRATRLVRFLMSSDKDYEVEIHIGLATDTYDVTGREIARSNRRPAREEIASALKAFSGEFLQTPPPYSAKKIAGRRAYALARGDVAVQPAPSPVRVDRLELVDVSDHLATVRVTCSAGFYVRSLAHDLGVRLGTGACLAALRRTRTGQFDLGGATRLDELVSDPAGALRRAVSVTDLLPQYPAVVLTEEGLRWVTHGRTIGPEQLAGPINRAGEWVRLLGPDGGVVALGRPAEAPGSLHPSVVLI